MTDYNELMSSALSVQRTLEMMEARFAALEAINEDFADNLAYVKTVNLSHLDNLRSYNESYIRR